MSLWGVSVQDLVWIKNHIVKFHLAQLEHINVSNRTFEVKRCTKAIHKDNPSLCCGGSPSFHRCHTFQPTKVYVLSEDSLSQVEAPKGSPAALSPLIDMISTS